MKRLLLSIMVMAVLASCGKDNKVNSDLAGAAAAGVNTYTTTNPLLVNNPQAADLVNRINNPTTGFGLGSTSNGATTWNALLTQYPSAVLRYTNGTVRNSDVTIVQKQTQLMNLVNSAQAIQVQGTIFYLTVNNAIYAIDSRYAIQINPSGLKSGYSEVFFIDVI